MVILKVLELYLCIVRKTMFVMLYLMGQVTFGVQDPGHGFGRLT
jgi:hypothetical protein